MTPEELLELAQRALAEGDYSLDEIAAQIDVRARALGFAISPAEGGGLGQAFRNRQESVELKREAEGLARVGARSPLANVAISAIDAGTFRLLDELLPGATGERFRQAAEENIEFAPTAAGASGAMSLLAPGLLAAKGTRLTGQALRGAGGALQRGGGRVLPALGRQLARPAATAAVAGAGISSGATGLMEFGRTEGTPGERLTAAREMATDPLVLGMGAIGGPILGAAGSRAKRILGPRGPRVASELRETTGLGRRGLNAVREQADEGVAVAKAGLDKVEAANPEIVSGRLETFLDDLRARPDVAGNLRRASIEVAEGRRFADVRDMRRLQANLRRDKRFGDVDELDQILSDAVPGYKDANTAFRQSSTIREAIELGERGSGRTFEGVKIKTNTKANLERALEALPAEAQDGFLEGLISRELQGLDRPLTGGSVKRLQNLSDNVQANGKLRGLFRDPAKAEEFIHALNTNVSAAKIKRLLVAGGVLVTVGAGAQVALGSAVRGFLTEGGD